MKQTLTSFWNIKKTQAARYHASNYHLWKFPSLIPLTLQLQFKIVQRFKVLRKSPYSHCLVLHASAIFSKIRLYWLTKLLQKMLLWSRNECKSWATLRKIIRFWLICPYESLIWSISTSHYSKRKFSPWITDITQENILLDYRIRYLWEFFNS